jgi:DNA-binding NarL/FixJ family response regulator
MCVDDHRLVREGLELIINQQPDMTVVAVAEDGEQAVKLYLRHKPDVTLMDLQLPLVSGLQAIRAIRDGDSNARIVVLTMYSGDEDIHRALKMGAMTYVMKDSLSKDLIHVVRAVHAGERPMSQHVADQLSIRTGQPSLTAREVQVLELIANGMRNKEIAVRLEISEMTVEAHIKHVFAKLCVSDRTAAVTVALRRGFIHL